jgi:hypothetical protein
MITLSMIAVSGFHCKTISSIVIFVIYSDGIDEI